ncbi:hypothetical protein dsmv_3290 [Desulfococcus multivorans DSM 2059]|uniref:Uncharacterized protein n=1 Tax=Desulfococcus multivorans DSM 2059 TaxID=1121405 RepID=S7UKY9_DESML|nr:hypothetical protein dsmv_3290 [Desulfococcus multivorans DSM 2059]SKA30188.1 hypothetical protein SAMN02745446_03876 [Desulfococcus multivorans DSM 2059]
MGNRKAAAAGNLNNLKVTQSSDQIGRSITKNNKTYFQVIGRGAISDRRILVTTYGIRRTAELPMLERGSSATKPGHAVTNLRISEGSTVVFKDPVSTNGLERHLLKSLFFQNQGRQSIFFLTTVNHIRWNGHHTVRFRQFKIQFALPQKDKRGMPATGRIKPKTSVIS